MPDGTRAECYAKVLAEQGVAKSAYPHGFEHHYWREGRLGEMRRRKIPSLIFIDSMSDLFGHWVPDEHIRIVLDEVKNSPQHICQALTKNAPRILEYLEILPDNLWVGVSSPPDEIWGNPLSQNQQAKMLGRQLAILSAVRTSRPDIITWMSVEPLSWDSSISTTMDYYVEMDADEVAADLWAQHQPELQRENDDLGTSLGTTRQTEDQAIDDGFEGSGSISLSDNDF